MVKEMTKGKPFPIIISFCIPLLLGNVFQQFYNMVDSIIVGKFIGVDALAAVGSTGSINFLIIGFVLGISSGFCIPVSQRFGAGDIKDMRRYVANSIYLGIGVTILLTAITMLFTRQILILMQTPADILEAAYSYIIYIFGGIVVIMAFNLMSSLLRALGDSRTPLYFLAIASVVNVALDLVFVIVFRMGVAGAGLATVIAQAVSALLCLIYIRRSFPILRFEKDELAFSWKHCKRLLAIGVPMALQFSITAIGAIILQIAVNKLGTNIIAAVTASNRINGLLFQPLETLGITMATYCGQNLGAKKLLRIKKGIGISIKMMLVYSVFAGVLIWFFGRYIAMIFVDSGEAALLDNVQMILRFAAVCCPILGLLHILRSSLQGMGFSVLPMMAGVSELIARSLVAFLLVGWLGFTAVCLAGPIAWLFADLLLVPAYFICMRKLNRTPKRDLDKVNA